MSIVEKLRAATLAGLARRWVTGEAGSGRRSPGSSTTRLGTAWPLSPIPGSDRLPATPSRSVVGHDLNHSGVLLPEALRWLWRPDPTPATDDRETTLARPLVVT